MRWFWNITLITAVTVTAGCGAFGRGADRDTPRQEPSDLFLDEDRLAEEGLPSANRTTLFDAFGPTKTEQTVQVNRYLWAASLEVLDFLPIQSVDPFTGVILTNYGTPPGGGQSYRATVHIKDPALDARSLNVGLQTRNGRAVNPATARAVEDAILSRARQLRIADKKL
ncbi:DUF3576 domain-containing protein [Epibacterium sp. SM1979]|uniref:DUF3576 domain-containing protein n=1 Tax=Tritonibacter litoralis TaxID=2662264 RepID=A0A843YE51_9RHOB|nr:DUF3576 domain-containing protein [Tritonibacter litoralis]MQQ08138.1 DUF3576 domain-containing protein [Tritonibacter litoralis]